MKAPYLLSAGIMGVALSATAGARSISYDEADWTFSATSSSGITSLTGPQNESLAIAANGGLLLDDVGFLFSVTPLAGQKFAEAYDQNYQPEGALLPGLDTSDNVNAYKFDWGTDPTQNAGSTPPLNGISEQVVIYRSIASPGEFEVDFNFAASSCASSTPTALIFGTPYVGSKGPPLQAFASTNPCASDSSFLFGPSGPSVVPSGWISGNPVSAPEIDLTFAAGSVTLLLGGLAVIAGRRRSQG